VVVLAQEESRTTFKHNYIGTEHILLGLLREEEGLAARVLGSLDITIERVRAAVLRIVGAGEEPTSGQIPFTPRATKVLELALREALSLGHNYIGTEHILLGLVRENEQVAGQMQGVAVRILLDFHADSEKVRNEMLRILPAAREAAHRSLRDDLSARPIDWAWFDGIGGFLKDLAAEIRNELKREPNSGDLLLALGCAPTLAGRTLREFGVSLGDLPSVIERVGAQALPTDEDRIEEVRQGKERAIEAKQFEAAAQLRDKERRLTEASRRNRAAVLQEIRRRLGLPRTDNPPHPPEAS